MRQTMSVLALSLAMCSAARVLADHPVTNGYMNHDALTAALTALAGEHDAVTLGSIGQSASGRPIHLLTLGSGDAAGPALLITAGIDARHLVGTETAYRVARDLVTNHADLLADMTVYVIPRVNPDGAEAHFGEVLVGAAGNAHPVDEDRDRATDEDGPDDLNGDGVITMMRRLHPPLDDPATHLEDPDDPRANKTPDGVEGERAAFSLYTEGLDDDGDGLINEDGTGYVDLDQNFMHLYPTYGTYAGAYQLSEPESHALAEFVLEHKHIVMAITYGRHDNLVNTPSDSEMDITGRAPRGIHEDDAALYEAVAELFEETTGLDSAPDEDIAGSFHAWLYGHRGIPSFSTTVWARPAEEGEKEAGDDSSTDEGEVGLTPSGVGDISQETLDELLAAAEDRGMDVTEDMIASLTPDMVVQFATASGIKVRRVSSAGGEEGTDAKSAEEKSWLAYSDERDGVGFVDWTPFDHPTLGKVEIGGFVPLFRMNPPAAELDALAASQTAFAVELMGQRPRLRVQGPQIKALSPGLYEIRIAIINEGAMPTKTRMAATARAIPAMVLRLSTPVDRIVTGERVSMIWGVEAHGGRSDHRWIIRSDDLNAEQIDIVNAQFGDHTIRLRSLTTGD